MRILYGVTGCGLGHTMRSRALCQHLVTRGHRVMVAASGRAATILRGHGLDVVEIDGMTMRYDQGGVHRRGTVYDLLRQAPRSLARNADVALDHVVDFDPDAMVTDFDSFAHVLGAVLNRPVISVDHQHVLDRFQHERAIRSRVSTYKTAHVFVSAKVPRCAHYVVTSFFFPEVRRRQAGSTTLVGPIVRPAVERARATREDHVLVYQTSDTDSSLIDTLRTSGRQRFVVYGLGRTETVGNVELRPFDEARFIADLASARAVISNGGFTTLSEAMYLHKPVLSIPVRGQPEQELNAAYLEALGLGSCARFLSPRVLRRFLDRLDSFDRPSDPRIATGTADARAALDRALAEAV